MNTSILMFVIAGALIITGFGVLSNHMGIDLQKLGVFPDTDSLSSYSCACQEPGSDPPVFGIDFCDFNPESPGFIGQTAADTCEAEIAVAAAIPTSEGSTEPTPQTTRVSTSGTVYGASLEEDYWEGEGCTTEFWDENSESSTGYAWPENYQPENKFNEIFSTNITINRIMLQDEAMPIDDEFLFSPLRGRADSTGLQTGTATFARESSEQETSDGSSTQVGSLVVQSSSPESTLETTESFDSDPTLITSLRLPAIAHTSGDVIAPSWGFGSNELVRESTTALLNAAHPQINYYYTEEKIISLTQEAFRTGSYFQVIEELNYFNTQTEGTLCP